MLLKDTQTCLVIKKKSWVHVSIYARANKELESIPQ